MPDQLWGVATHSNLVAALRASGRDEDAKRLLDKANAMLEIQRKNGADNMFFWYSAAQVAAQLGDRQRLFSSLRNAIDTGYISVFGCDSVVFEELRTDPRFIDLEQEMKRRANDERRELGLLAI